MCLILAGAPDGLFLLHQKNVNCSKYADNQRKDVQTGLSCRYALCFPISKPKKSDAVHGSKQTRIIWKYRLNQRWFKSFFFSKHVITHQRLFIEMFTGLTVSDYLLHLKKSKSYDCQTISVLHFKGPVCRF